MPSQLLHILFGEDVISAMCRAASPRFGVRAGKALDRIRNTYSKVFSLGCQGPDIFYHSRRRRPVALEYGTLLHRRGVGVFTAGLLKLGLPAFPPEGADREAPAAETEINALGVYALGFMTHAILDRHTHPYIVYKSDSFSPSRPENLRSARFHAFFERVIDTLMYRHLRAEEISSWDQEGVLTDICLNPPAGLKELLARALVMAFPERAGKDEKLGCRIENAFLDCAGFYRMSAPAYTPERDGFFPSNAERRDYLAYQYPEKLPGDIDFLNLEHKPWYYPAGDAKEDTRSFPEIYGDAVNAAAASFSALFARYLEEGIFPAEEAAKAIGNGGLSIVDENGKPCAPCRSQALPLAEVLEQQAALRGISGTP